MQSLASKQSVRAPFTGRAPSRRCSLVVRATAETTAEVVKDRKLGPLAKGGTLSGEAAAGKDAGVAAKVALGVAPAAAQKYFNQIVDGKYRDDRWVDGKWDYACFKKSDGETDWDKVIDAEIARRKLLEDYPIPSTNEDPVNFDTAEVPWYVWVKRFHLPEAEKLNGRAAMMGYILAALVDLVSGAGLVDQQESFLGKVALHICVFGILLVRSSADLDKYKGLIDEATFYDKQWQATWEGQMRPSEKKE